MSTLLVPGKVHEGYNMCLLLNNMCFAVISQFVLLVQVFQDNTFILHCLLVVVLWLPLNS